MWIMANNSYLSIVNKDSGPAELLVRTRFMQASKSVAPVNSQLKFVSQINAAHSAFFSGLFGMGSRPLAPLRFLRKCDSSAWRITSRIGPFSAMPCVG